ncbi:MAG: reverse transcriptase domain-containing protein, partial [Cyanobacteria bacterium J06648_11]
WLYEGRIVEIDDTGAQPIYNIEFSNGHRQLMSAQEVSENRVIDTSQFDERNVGIEISTDNILPEGSRRSRNAMMSARHVDTRQAYGAKKNEYKNGILIPRSHAQAMRSPECEEWLKAEQKEIDAMRTYEVFEQVDYLPKGTRPLHFMVLYTVKDDGRFKVRMVARGDRQTEDTYDNTHSPVVRTVTLRYLIAVAAIYDLAIYQTDVNTAYLNAPIDFDIYFIAPDCFPIPGAYLRARKAIYGLKQAGVCWYLELEEKLVLMGFKRTIFDYCVWGAIRNDSPVFIATYVDDLVFIGTDENCRQVLSELKSYYICRDDQELSTFLGMDFTRVQNGRNASQFSVCMKNYIHKYAAIRGIGPQNRLKLSKVPGAVKPVADRKGAVKFEDEQSLDADDKRLFQSLVGAFQWITGCSRPDI